MNKEIEVTLKLPEGSLLQLLEVIEHGLVVCKPKVGAECIIDVEVYLALRNWCHTTRGVDRLRTEELIKNYNEQMFKNLNGIAEAIKK